MQREVRHGRVDGIERFQRGRLAGTPLASGPIWPVREEEKRLWRGVAVQYLLMTARIAGSPSGEPEKKKALSVEIKPDHRAIEAETFDGKVRIGIPDLSQLGPDALREMMERINEMPVEPLGREDLVFSACSTTLTAGKRRLILATDDIRLVSPHFWPRLALVGINKVGDIQAAAEREVLESPTGILFRLRHVAEKIASAGSQPVYAVVKQIIRAAIKEGRVEDSVQWLEERTSGIGTDAVLMTAYNMLAKDGFDPLHMLKCAYTLANDSRFRHEYRPGNRANFEYDGIRKLLYEMWVIGEKMVEQDLAKMSGLNFEAAQEYARAFQFIREMQEVMHRCSEMIGNLKDEYEL